MHRSFDLDVTVVCDNGPLTDPSLSFELDQPDDQCSDLVVSLNLATDEISYWGAVTPIINWL